MSIRTLALLLLSALFFTAQQWGQVPGTVTGTVVDNAGKPVVRARIFISVALPANAPRPAAPPVMTGPTVISTMSDQNGEFISGHLAAGAYVACAQASTEGLLDPCHWATVAPQFTIAAGTTTAGVKITMVKGAILPIHVDDPHKLLATSNGIVEEDLQFHVVTAKGHHYDALITARTSNSRDHVITVPFGTTVSVQAISRRLEVNDDSGKPAIAGKSVNVPGAGNAVALHYTVSGVKQ